MAAAADAACYATLLAFAGCAQIFGFEEGTPPTATATAASGAGGAGGATGTNGVGGGGAACDPSLCPGATDCLTASCDAEGACALDPVPAGSACNDGLRSTAKLCEGSGECVECLGDDDCNGGETCDATAHECVPLHCANGQEDSGETGVDCGGADCAPCPNGQGCNAASDCASGYCNQGTCAGCSTSSQCLQGQWCDAGVCEPLSMDGSPCNVGASCVSNACVDGVCCNSLCGNTCESCLAQYTSAPNGSCAPIMSGTDPQSECTANAVMCQAGTCSGTGSSCAPSPMLTVCRPAFGECDVEETCNGMNVGCPPDVFAPLGTACGNGQACSVDGQCASPTGAACQQGSDCATYYCIDGLCCNTPCASLCESCARSGLEGQCTPYDFGTDPEAECGGGMDCCNGTPACGLLNCL